MSPTIDYLIEREELRREVEELRGRLRTTAQTLIDEVGADGPMDAEDAASKAVAEIARLRAENERLKADQTDGNMDYLSLRDLADKAIMQREEWGLNNAQLRQDNIRLRALLKEALVPCGTCDGDGCEACIVDEKGMPSQHPGYVPVEVEP